MNLIHRHEIMQGVVELSHHFSCQMSFDYIAKLVMEDKPISVFIKRIAEGDAKSAPQPVKDFFNLVVGNHYNNLKKACHGVIFPYPINK